jgi:hypothetical protein
MAQHFPIVSLPAELTRRTVSYLCPQDAFQLSQTCKNLHSSLSLRLLRNSRLLFTRHISSGDYTGDREVPFVRIPRLSRRVHSVTLTFRWRDQGWGNRKGQVWVVGRYRHAPVVPDQRFQGGRIVCESRIAPHGTEDCKMTVLPMEGELYQLWYRVGGGGGHQLMLSEGRLLTVMFDDEQGNVSRNYEILENVGAIGVHPESMPAAPTPTFYPQLLLRVSQSLRSQLANQRDSNIPLDDSLAAFFRMYMIPVTEGSLLAVEEIIQSNLDDEHASISVPPQPTTDESSSEESQDDEDDISFSDEE